LKSNEETVRAICEASPDTIMLLDEHGFLDCNSATLEMFDCTTANEFLGRHPSEYSPPTQADGRDSLEAANDKISVAYKTGSNFFEWTHQRANGEVFPAEVQLTLLKLKDGDILQATVRDITKRKQAEAELLLKDLVFEHSITANSIAGPDCIITDANGTFARLWGHNRRHSIIGKPIAAFLNVEDEAIEIIDTLNETGQWEGEYTALREDGSTFCAYGLASTIYNGSGGIIGYQSSVLDITHRKQEEEKLARERLLFSTLFESAADYALLLEIQESGPPIIINANSAAFIRHGYSREEMIGKPITLLDTKSSAKQVKKRLGDIKKGGIVHFEVEHACKDGSTFIAESASSLVVIDENHLFCSIERDITERKQAEESLKIAEAHFRGVVESAKDAFISMNSSGIISEWNPEAERMFGFSKDEVMGNKLSDTIVPEEYRAMHTRGLERHLETGESKVLNKAIQIHGLHKDGHLFPVELSIVPLVDSNKSVTFNAFIRNLTEQHEAQDKLRESEAALKNSLIGTIGAICKAVEARDPYTSGHQVRVSRLAKSIAQGLGLDDDQTEGVKVGAMIHDIGKIQTPSEILSKPSTLNELEYQIIKTHANTGYEILKDVDFPWPVADIAHQHHEHLDGSGYPQGLKGDQICIEARIVAVADSVEAISSHRPYRPSLGIEAALNEISANRGTWYDPDVVDVCLKLFKEERFAFD